ncbi:MAG TPA: tRNA (pseudouridine(54)-N(1))-methyltransferase TrmY [Methanoregulaceae archaeon]|nr:tRNA (pseudouridine(54)-N(1))-methyltransferase TrmY [Methanoregulaceae archaeon]
MTVFAVIGHLAKTTGDFTLNDMPGGAGRMDVLCRCVNTSLFLSHDLRRDVTIYLVLLGGTDSPKTVMISGEKVRYLSPDERSAGSLIKKALEIPAAEEFRESTRGVFVRRGGLGRLMKEHEFAVLDENGADIAGIEDLPEGFILSDHMDFTAGEQEMMKDLPRYSVGPRVLHADHTITVLLNRIDRRRAGME